MLLQVSGEVYLHHQHTFVFLQGWNQKLFLLVPVFHIQVQTFFGMEASTVSIGVFVFWWTMNRYSYHILLLVRIHLKNITYFDFEGFLKVDKDMLKSRLERHFTFLVFTNASYYKISVWIFIIRSSLFTSSMLTCLSSTRHK